MSTFEIALCFLGVALIIVNVWIISIWMESMGGANRICPSPPVENKELSDKYLELLVEKYVRLRHEIENKEKKT